jgi:glutamate-1-semialdehyde 2,1-aminomutase
MVQFCTSGAEATGYALRLARAATGRELVVKFEGAFHGSNDYALMSMAPAGTTPFPRAVPDSGGIPAGVRDAMLISPYNDLGALESIVRDHGDSIAAIIVEPLQRIISAEPGFLEGVRRIATRAGAVLVFDEIVTGFRLALGGAQELYGVNPDLACYGKIIGGGFPLAAVAGSADIMELCAHARAGQSDFVYMSGTLNGDPVGATAGLATINVLERPGAFARLHEIGRIVRERVSNALATAGLPAQVLGEGPLFQPIIGGHAIRNYGDLLRADSGTADRLARGVVDSGIYTTGKKGYLSLAHTDEDVECIVSAYADAVTRVAASA